MSPPISDQQVSALSTCVLKGRKIEAIKLYREMTGLGLQEAKDAIDEMEKSLRMSSLDANSPRPQSKGCLGVLVVGLLCSGVFITYWLA